MKGLFFTLSVLFLLTGCKTSEQTITNTTPLGKRYAIGKGGGINGIYNEFILSENGKVHKYDFNYDREVYFKDLGKADLIYFLERIEALSLEGIEMTEPGNRTFYVDVRIGKTSINKVVWGNYNFHPDQELIDFHKELYEKMSTWD
ncbi:hypothetical protein N9242_04325 [Vicingaceae bacterium]|jgi:hypothetical protein|nr:hypothetical protein [Vicingaceae bacterium]